MYLVEELKLEQAQDTGHNFEWLALCPFHNDKEAGSFFVNAKSGFFTCFACGVSGNIFQLVKRTKGKIVTIPDHFAKQKTKKVRQVDWGVYLNAPIAIDNEYLINKRHLNNDIIRKFSIRDTNRGIAFPLFNWEGQIIGFQERLYIPDPMRYILHGERPLFYTPLTPDELAQKQKVYVVEGIFGVANAFKYGYTAIAVMGASSITPLTFEVLTNPEVVVLFDNDEAGIKNCRHILEIANRKVGILPGDEADELVKQEWDSYDKMIPFYKKSELCQLK